MKAADPLQRYDPAALDRFGDRRDGMAEARPAAGASNGLRMKAAARNVAIISGARLAERKGRHCGLLPVIRGAMGNRKARSAMRAGDEGIKIEAACRIEEIFEAGIACGGVRDDQRARRAGIAPADLEALAPFRRYRREVEVVDAGERRTLALEGRDEAVERLSLDLQQHAVAVIQHKAR